MSSVFCLIALRIVALRFVRRLQSADVVNELVEVAYCFDSSLFRLELFVLLNCQDLEVSNMSATFFSTLPALFKTERSLNVRNASSFAAHWAIVIGC